MARYEVAPTRTNLARLKSELSFAREGYALLEQKREILIMELKRYTARAIDTQARADTELARAHDALHEAQLAAGFAAASTAARAVNTVVDVSLQEHRVMGVSLPGVALAVDERPPYYGPALSSAWTDEAARRFGNAMVLLAELAESRISVLRLTREIQKTIRRVNALEKILIPDYEASKRYVEDALEESDRDALFALKLIKERLESMGERR